MVALERELIVPETRDVYLVVKRKPLKDVPWLWRTLARWIYQRIGWASDYSVEYQGVYEEESEARHAANGDGMSYTTLPLNTSLPVETAQYRVHDFPLSEASASYRARELPFIAVRREDLDDVLLLEAKVNQTVRGLESKCARA